MTISMFELDWRFVADSSFLPSSSVSILLPITQEDNLHYYSIISFHPTPKTLLHKAQFLLTRFLPFPVEINQRVVCFFYSCNNYHILSVIVITVILTVYITFVLLCS